MSLSHSDPTFNELLRTHPAVTADPQKGLMVGSVALSTLADEVGTPCWVINAETLRLRAQLMQQAFADASLPVTCHFAVKSQDNQACLTVLGQAGWGADVVSGGELKRALAAGIPADKIVFSGVGKTDDELKLAITHDIAQVNVESAEELHRLNGLAQQMERTIRVSLRVNPDVDAKTHSKITTGRAEDKFGIAYTDIPTLYRTAQRDMQGLNVRGLAVHLGSQISTEEPFRQGYSQLAKMVTTLRQDGLSVEDIDCGGGLGITYRNEIAPAPTMLAQVMADIFGALDVNLRVEPGRWLSAPAGVLLSRVIDTKQGTHQFVILDAAMSELVRPAMYDSWHGILPVHLPDAKAETSPVDVVGPICESSDTFAKQRMLPPLKRNDLVAILDAGAYGSTMSSTYNSRPFAAQIMVDGDQWAVIRPRQTLEDLLACEKTPHWLTQGA
ncbi:MULTISPECIES: diaminopimelate decarboxylase [unclassified Saccharibacter]|uniref:diaminopimelate decarboxylase n=1 Tax=unclassified Saccharibacter TaxID=2648722 RepID=UPI0013258DCE|nr:MULTISPECIES: diaminopimelate decarboxylase [unclassified Saccharibacter]MXV36245.1 diaminopimelate decarboxylase [Saccharibacter sp. EH611]MXV57105.1 diaminopimelate decarboxylase [Saccharibacter sp. EH70]MXV66535.1 diaminopimelate decarboxylase [Saccharibacter sp. EH60]